MEKFFIVNEQATTADIGDTVHDVLAVPVSKLRGMTNDATGGVDLVLHFEGSAEGSADGDASSSDTITLTITANKHVAVMKAIADAVNKPGIAGNAGQIVLWEAEAGVSEVSTYITGAAVAVAAVD